jgi:hypothetical protein
MNKYCIFAYQLFFQLEVLSCHGAFCCNIKISTLNFAMLESQVNNAKNNPHMPAACKIHSYALELDIWWEGTQGP